MAGLRLLFIDQAEFYAVCPRCFEQHREHQWSGHTRFEGWRAASQRRLAEARRCELCGAALDPARQRCAVESWPA